MPIWKERLYMSLYDNNQRLDSAEVKDDTFILKGKLAESSFARLDLVRKYANFIAGEGEVVVDFETHLPVSGNKVNMAYKQTENELRELDKGQSVKADSLRRLDIPQEEKYALLKATPQEIKK